MFCFFTLGAMVCTFIAVKNRYSTFSVLLKFSTTQNAPRGAEANYCNPQPATAIHGQFFLTISIICQVLTIPLLTEEALFTSVFWSWVSLFKYLQEFKVAYQWRQLERLIFDYIWACLGNPRHTVIGGSY